MPVVHISTNNHENKREVIIYLSVFNTRKTKIILKMHSTWLVLCNFFSLEGTPRDQLKIFFHSYVLHHDGWKLKVSQWTCCYLTVSVLMDCTPSFLQLEHYLKFVFNFIFHYVLTKIFREKFLHLCEDFTESLFLNIIILCKYFLRNTNPCFELGNPYCSRTCLAYISYTVPEVYFLTHCKIFIATGTPCIVTSTFQLCWFSCIHTHPNKIHQTPRHAKGVHLL